MNCSCQTKCRCGGVGVVFVDVKLLCGRCYLAYARKLAKTEKAASYMDAVHKIARVANAA